MAQLVAHHTGSVGVRGSSPLGSTQEDPGQGTRFIGWIRWTVILWSHLWSQRSATLSSVTPGCDHGEEQVAVHGNPGAKLADASALQPCLLPNPASGMALADGETSLSKACVATPVSVLR